jgi:hypothetical protein
VLRPRETDHDAEAFVRRGVEKLAARRRVGANRVDAERRHLPEVGGDLLNGWELVALRVGRERTVRHAFDEEALVDRIRASRFGEPQEFPLGHHARG